jgi:hypothetical protein
MAVVIALAIVPASGLLGMSSGSVGLPNDQNVTVLITGPLGHDIRNASVQGFMATPPNMGGGLRMVFAGHTDANGRIAVTNVSKLIDLSHEWVKYQGTSLASMSSPYVLLFVTKVYGNGSIYFTQSSVPITTMNIIHGKSAHVHVILNTHGKSTMHLQNNKRENGKALSNIGSAIPLEGSSLPTIIPGFGYEWVECSNYTYYPSNGPGNIPVSWVNSLDSSYGWVGSAMFASTSDSLNVGVALGSNGWSFENGGSIWHVTSTYASGDSTGPANGGQTWYLDMYGQVEGAWYQLWYTSCGYAFPEGEYQYDTGIVNVQNIPGSSTTFSVQSSAPSGYVSNVLKSYSYNEIGGAFTGTGSSGYYPNDTYLASTSLVNDYAASDTSWINVGLPVGALLLLVPGIDIPDAIALGIVATLSYTTSSSSNAVSWADAGAYSGNDGNIWALVGSTSYTLSNGQTGNIPLMYVQTTSYSTSGGGGGGCVLNGTEITLANGTQIPVQDLKPGMKTLSYDTVNKQLIRSTVVSDESHNVSSVIELNHAIYISGMSDQPVYVKLQNGSQQWVVLGEVNYTMSLFDPVNNTWIPVHSIIWRQGNFTVYDVVTARQFVSQNHTEVFNDYIANGFLLDMKIIP